MQRSYAQFTRAHTSSVEYEDALLHFMQDCWHLKDWIKNDPRNKVSSKLIEGSVKKYPALMIAADLANASKHLRLDREPRAGGAKIAETSVTLQIGYSQPQPVEIACFISTKPKGAKKRTRVSAEDAARDALAAWDTLLRSLRLRP